MESEKYCPGSRKLRNPQPEFIQCSHCGEEVEIWTDEAKATCPNCKNVLHRALKPSCIDWCKFAEQCFGVELHGKLKEQREESTA